LGEKLLFDRVDERIPSGWLKRGWAGARAGGRKRMEVRSRRDEI